MSRLCVCRNETCDTFNGLCIKCDCPPGFKIEKKLSLWDLAERGYRQTSRKYGYIGTKNHSIHIGAKNIEEFRDIVQTVEEETTPREWVLGWFDPYLGCSCSPEDKARVIQGPEIEAGETVRVREIL